ncbi:helix-turn-helix domain-containing protein [Klebsiella pneumoniae]|nr:helix-turn-helix domain-containing protein [Klebsiella pneumoniae]MCM6104188.1 helix-turn-helix domain-containing protein [Klebsiella pneumoniae]
MSGIKSLRRKAKVTQGELAALIDSSQGAVSHYETGRRIPDVQSESGSSARLNSLA